MVTWWDWGPVNVIVNGFWGTLAAAASTTAAIQALPMVIAGILISIGQVIAYPFVLAVNLVQNIIVALLTPFVNLFNSFIQIGNSLVLTINIFSGTFPSPWLLMLGIILGAQVALRIYFFVKDIEIVGNKI